MLRQLRAVEESRHQGPGELQRRVRVELTGLLRLELREWLNLGRVGLRYLVLVERPRP